MKILVATVLLSSSLAAEVHTVGPPGSASDFETIQAAVDAAAPGDVVVVAPGEYDGFHLAKGVQVFGAGSGSTHVVAPVGSVTAILALDVPAGQVAIVAGMDVQPSPIGPPGGPDTVKVEPMAGTLVLHDVRTADGIPGELHVAGANRFVLSRATIVGHPTTWSPTFRATGSRVWLVDSDLSKELQTPESFVGSTGTARLIQSTGWLTGCTLLGADIAPEWDKAGDNGLELQASAAFAERVTLLGGDGAMVAMGGFGATLTSESTLLVGASATIEGGLDGSGLVEQAPVKVEPGSQVAQAPRALPTISAASALASAGDTLVLTLRADPGDAGLLFASLAPGAGATIAGIAGDVFLDLGAPIHLGPVALDGAGEARIELPVPALPEPTLATFQWARISSAVEASNPAFVAVD